jgi:endogenous inhibitor of DNA gyrase (YacG/DUF329 family)
MTKKARQEQIVITVKDEDKVQYCEFCGTPMTDMFPTGVSMRRKYCSDRCRSIATSRRTSARLGIPPARRSVSRLSNPLYFN